MSDLISLIYLSAFGTTFLVGCGVYWDIQMRKRQREEQAGKEKIDKERVE